jgi:protein TonB
MACAPSNLKKRIQTLMQSMHFSSEEYQRVGVRLSSMGILLVVLIGLSVQPNVASQVEVNSSKLLSISTNKESAAPPETNTKKLTAPDEQEVFAVVEQAPKLKGGYASLLNAIQYPEEARLKNIEGRVFVQFIIDTEGKVRTPEVIRGIGYGCDEAALEAVKQLEFEPGVQRGRTVNVRYSLPIVFKLQ